MAYLMLVNIVLILLSISIRSQKYYSARVPEMVKSFRSVSEIILVLYLILIFTILSILVLNI